MKCHFSRVINRQTVASAAVALSMAAANGVSADPISYSVLDHPDGTECGNGGCYVLRLDGAGGVNTFSAEAPGTGLTFTFDPAFANVAFINGIVSHNQAPANRFSLSVALAGVDFTDGAGPHWYVSDAGLYDDSLSDLQTFSSGGAQTPNDSVSFSEDYDRINFLSTYLEISLFSGTDSFGPRIAGLDFSDCASGVYCFDDFPNDATKPFFIQRDYRIDGHASFDGALAADEAEAGGILALSE